MLSQAQLIPYLLQRKLIGARSVVEADLTILDVSRRNHNFAALRKHGSSYLLKQGIDPERAASIAHEAQVYRLFNSDAQKGEFTRRYLPRYIDYDPEEHVLILEFLTDARNLQEHYTRHGRFSCRIAVSMGNALSAFHRSPWSGGMGKDQTAIHRQPWIFSLHRPDLLTLCSVSEANVELIKIVQRYSEFSGLLDELRQEWRVEAFIHSDIKWDNCLLSVSEGNTALKMIDWELAGPGDPVWDVGSVFSAYLSFWLLFVPVTAASQPDEFLQRARYPLEKMQPALRSFWKSYVKGLNLDPTTAEQVLIRAVRYGAARLVQLSFEQMQQAPKLIGNAVCSLQLSLNILKRPETACAVLLGLPLLSK